MASLWWKDVFEEAQGVDECSADVPARLRASGGTRRVFDVAAWRLTQRLDRYTTSLTDQRRGLGAAKDHSLPNRGSRLPSPPSLILWGVSLYVSFIQAFTSAASYPSS